MAKKRSRKAQGLPLTTIIIAAVGLIVLVVLVAIFTGRIGGFTTTVKETQSVDCRQTCMASGYGSSTGPNQPAETITCDKPFERVSVQGKWCCCVPQDVEKSVSDIARSATEVFK